MALRAKPEAKSGSDIPHCAALHAGYWAFSRLISAIAAVGARSLAPLMK
jgi:hypothetical protein